MESCCQAAKNYQAKRQEKWAANLARALACEETRARTNDGGMVCNVWVARQPLAGAAALAAVIRACED